MSQVETAIREIIREEIDYALNDVRNQIQSLRSDISNKPERHELESDISRVKSDIEDLKSKIRHSRPIY